jgi:hypothetical protein
MATYFGDPELDIKITEEKKRQRVTYDLLMLLVKLELWPSYVYGGFDRPMTPAHPNFKSTMKQLYGVGHD